MRTPSAVFSPYRRFMGRFSASFLTALYSDLAPRLKWTGEVKAEGR